MAEDLSIGNVLVTFPRVVGALAAVGALIVPALPYFQGLDVAVQITVLVLLGLLAVALIGAYAYYVTKRRVAEIQKEQSAPFAGTQGGKK